MIGCCHCGPERGSKTVLGKDSEWEFLVGGARYPIQLNLSTLRC